MLPPAAPIELRCPACGRYLGTLDGCYFRSPPCVCGIQTTVQATGKRLRGFAPGMLRELELK